MGVDFLKKKAKAFTKGLDADRVASVRHGLFADGADTIASGAVARMVTPRTLVKGDEVLVRADGERLVASTHARARVVSSSPTFGVAG